MACCRASSSWCRSPDAAAARDGFVEHGAALHLLHVLAEVADGELLGDGDVAFVGDFLAHHHAEERGLAGAVGADQADLFAGVQLKGSVDENQAACRTAC